MTLVISSDVIRQILPFLEFEDIGACQTLSKHWNTAQTPEFWNKLAKEFGIPSIENASAGEILKAKVKTGRVIGVSRLNLRVNRFLTSMVPAQREVIEFRSLREPDAILLRIDGMFNLSVLNIRTPIIYDGRKVMRYESRCLDFLPIGRTLTFMMTANTEQNKIVQTFKTKVIGPKTKAGKDFKVEGVRRFQIEQYNKICRFDPTDHSSLHEYESRCSKITASIAGVFQNIWLVVEYGFIMSCA